MNLRNLGTNIDATSATAQTAIDLGPTTPFGRGFRAVGIISPNNLLAGASAAAKIQTSPDNSTWTDAVTYGTGVKPQKMGEFELQRYVRFNVTGAGSAGTYNVDILI